MCDDFGEGEIGSLGIEVAFDDLKVGSDRAKVVVGFLVSQIAEAEDLGYLVGA